MADTQNGQLPRQDGYKHLNLSNLARLPVCDRKGFTGKINEQILPGFMVQIPLARVFPVHWRSKSQTGCTGSRRRGELPGTLSTRLAAYNRFSAVFLHNVENNRPVARTDRCLCSWDGETVRQARASEKSLSRW